MAWKIGSIRWYAAVIFLLSPLLPALSQTAQPPKEPGAGPKVKLTAAEADRLLKEAAAVNAEFLKLFAEWRGGPSVLLGQFCAGGRPD